MHPLVDRLHQLWASEALRSPTTLRRAAVTVGGAAAVGLFAWGLGEAVTPRFATPDTAERPLVIDGPPTNVEPAPPPPMRLERLASNPTPDDADASDAVEDADDDASATPADAPAATNDARAEVRPAAVTASAEADAPPRPTPASDVAAQGCQGLASPADRLVCASPRLVAADLRLQRLYHMALDDSDDPDAVRDDQRRWRAARERVAQAEGPEGLAELYAERIRELAEPE